MGEVTILNGVVVIGSIIGPITMGGHPNVNYSTFWTYNIHRTKEETRNKKAWQWFTNEQTTYKWTAVCTLITVPSSMDSFIT